MVEERKLSVDVNGFNVAMEEARQKARNARNKVLYHICLPKPLHKLIFTNPVHKMSKESETDII
jgi:alanyl-tRNA synthetase